jgi:hypothetical protein
MALDQLLSGYGGRAFPFPSIAGQYKGQHLVVCGDAINVWDDLDRFGCRSNEGRGKVRKDHWHFMTVNKLVETFPGHIEHVYSNEPHLLHKFIAARRSEYTAEFNPPANTHSCNEGCKWRWPWGGHGTSSLGATLVGLALGYEQVVLCGVPLDNGPHNGEPFWRKTGFATAEAAGPKGIVGGVNSHWKRAIEQGFDGKVRSMSGRTREWLGAPV